MGVRDEELKRLVLYARSLSSNVIFNYLKSNETLVEGAAWDSSTQEITINISLNQSKITTIIYLIHELGHHLSYIYDYNKINPKNLDTALVRFEQGLPLYKRHRKLILEDELRAMKYWKIIYTDTGLKFPKYRMYLERELDNWAYNYLYQVGRLPLKKEFYVKRKELQKIFNKSLDISQYEKIHSL